MSKTLKMALCLLLCLLMVTATVPTQVFASMADATGAQKPTKLNTASGEVDVSDEWETAYPYGCFVFEESEALLEEGGDTVEIAVFRLGGTTGRATAVVTYNPSVSPTKVEGQYSFLQAVSTDDLTIEVEDPLPFAQYDPLGKDPDPDECWTRISKYEDGTDYILYVDVTADSYQWYSKCSGRWMKVTDAIENELRVDKDDYSSYDFRCVYKTGESSYCTDSTKYEKYVKPEPEAIPDMPADIDLSAEPTFTTLVPCESEPYFAYQLPLTFADGEWKKVIRFTAKEDDLSECMENCTLIITDNEGGEIGTMAQSVSLTVMDNDPGEPFDLGLTETKGTFDKADGKAVFTVRRTGGMQEPVSIAYETVDGTAVKGVDYLAQTGAVMLYGDISEADIEIPLMDDGIKTDKKKSFTLRLTELKGDSENLCTLKETEATAYLYNSGTGKGSNLATVLKDPGAIDLDADEAAGSAVDISPDTVTGTQKIAEPIKATIRKGKSNSGQKTYTYPNVVDFSAFYNNSDYWMESTSTYDAGYTNISLSNPNMKSTVYSGDVGGGGFHLETGDDQKSTVGNLYVPIDNLPKLFSGFSASLMMVPFNDGAVPWIGFGGQEHIDKNNLDPTRYYYYYYTDVTQLKHSYSAAFNYDDDICALVLGLTGIIEPKSGLDESGTVDASETTLYRRSFRKSLGLTVHTANDGVEGEGNVVTAPDGGAALNSDSDVYDEMMPEISIVPGTGGVNGDGMLFVGSKIKVSLKETATYYPVATDELAASVYLTDSRGNVIQQAVSGGDKDFYLTFLWDGISDADLSKVYNINVVMTRKQTVTVDLSPSVPRKADGESLDLDNADKAFDAFWVSDSDKSAQIDITASKLEDNAPYFTYPGDNVTLNKGDSSLEITDGKAYLSFSTVSTVENFQSINFNRNHDDKIVFNGRPYAGDETIRLSVADLSSSDLHFYYYSKEYLSVPSMMNTSIDKAALYMDGNGNGRIDGTFDPKTGYFNLDDDTEDLFVTYLDMNGSYDESILNYYKDKDGVYRQMFLKIFYYMNPRTLADYSGTAPEPHAQVLPALTTSVTDIENYFALTTEQKNYRYLVSGLNADMKSYTADGHIMFGAEATAIQFVDVPLGGDKSPMVSTKNDDGSVTYSWTPQYEGNLLYPYSEPEPIYIENCIAGNNFPLAPDYDSTGTLSDKDIANLNGYLGSLVADTAVALCVRQQDKTTGEIIAMNSSKKGRKDSSNLLGTNTRDESSSLLSVSVPQNPTQVMDSQFDETFQSGVDTSKSGNKYTSFNAIVSTVFDKFNFSVWDFSIARNGDEFIIGFNFPLAAYSYKGDEDESEENPSAWTGPVSKIKNDAANWAEARQFVKGNMHAPADGIFDDYLPNKVDKEWGAGMFLGFGFSVSIYAALDIKYDNLTNKYQINKWILGLSFGITVSKTYRFVCCPLAYVSGTFSLSARVGTQIVYKENLQENSSALVSAPTDDEAQMKKGEIQVFPVTYRMLNIKFKGKLRLGLFEDQDCQTRVDESKCGTLTSDDDSENILLVMQSLKTYKFKDDKTYYLYVEASEDTTIDRLVEITDVSRNNYFDGFDLTPDIGLEFAIGTGASVCKIEAVVRVGFSFTFLDLKKLTSADLSISLSFRMAFMFFKYSMDLVGYTVSTSNGKDWTHQWRSLTGFANKSAKGAVDYDSFLSLPDDMSDTQKVYKQQDKASWLKAYDPTDDSVPFELSGYSSSSDAAKLADGLSFGSDYQVVTLKNADGDDVNYVLYHISRGSKSSIDSSMLVLSELKMTGVTPGFLNPVDHDSSTPYIPIDDDGTGDLEFHITPSSDGKSLRISWVNYQSAADTDAQADMDAFSTAVRNTEIKTATFTPGKTKDYITGSEVVSDDTGENVDLPTVAGDATVFVRSNHITDEELETRTELYSDYLASTGYDVNGDDDAGKNIAAYRIAAQRALWIKSGGSSDICVKVKDIPEARIDLDDGVTVENIDAKKIGSTYYIAYTTGQDLYTDSKGDTTTDKTEIANMLTVKRMYLRTFTVSDGKIDWGMDGKAVLIRTLYDYENGGNNSSYAGSLPDGVYADGKIIENRDDPYFTNIRFLNAKLGDALTGEEETLPLQKGRSADSAEDFLLFDMNGSTYIIRQSSLELMTGSGIDKDSGTTKGTIIPFFKPEVTEADGTASSASTGRVENTIGADGDGNLVAVYTSAVENTSDTALCISKYDSATGWGSKTVIAMNHLGVYEDNYTLGRTPEESEKAYLGLLDEDGDGTVDKDQKGSLDQFTFANPQIALGSETVTDETGQVSQKATLLVLTQGTMTYYKQNTDDETKDAHPILPVDASQVTASAYPRSAKNPAGLGVYALAYGVGTQAVGNGSLSMDVYDFSAGSDRYVTVGFENTGDIGIRGSEDQPIEVTLMASGSTAPLVTWNIKENIVPGQKVTLTGALDLTETLPADTELYLNVDEDSYYADQGGTPFSAKTDTILTIEEYPELSIDDYHIVLENIDESGNAVVDVDFLAASRGTAAANGVKVVFSYDTGVTDSNGEEIFSPLDITGNSLTMTTEELKKSKAACDPTKGELDLGNIEIGYGQHVIGKLYVPSSCFNEDTTDALKMKLELFSSGDDGLPEGEHNEYNSLNNMIITHVEHETFFAAPSRITVPSGNELRIPIDVKYTTGEEIPHIMVTEFPDLAGNMNFGKLSFRYGVFDDGHGEGTLELKPTREGTGYIRVKNTNTNSFYDIAYAVTASEPGINIYNDNKTFTFHNIDDSQFSDAQAGQNWSFRNNFTTWGADGTAPYLNDLSVGEIGSSFTFETVAESIDIVFNGSVEVQSTFDGFETVTVSATGGDGDSEGEYATVVFGKNPQEEPHTVTFIVKDGVAESDISPIKYCYFDRIIEHYNERLLPVPDDDANPPQIFFSRSFPGKGTVATGTKVKLKAYIFDETGLASVTLNNKPVTSITKDDVVYWTASLSFSKNGSYTIKAMDDLGNRSTHNIKVDWFDDAGRAEVPAVPKLTAKLMKRGADGEDDAQLTEDIEFTDDDVAYIKTSGKTSDGSGKPEYTVTQVTITEEDGVITRSIDADKDKTYPVRSDGWYLVKAADPDSDGECWTLTSIEMMRLTKRQLFVIADDKEKAEGDLDPEFTYTAVGLWDGDKLTGSLSRAEGDVGGAYDITLGTLSAGDDYHILYTGAVLDIKHTYAEPTWAMDDTRFETVTITVIENTAVDIHPDHYTVDGGDPIEKDCSKTKYVLTGNIGARDYLVDFRVTLHDGDDAAAEYHIYLDALEMGAEAGRPFMTVNGDNATVDLTLCGASNIWSNDYIFARGDSVTTDTTVNIASGSADETVFYMEGKTFAADGITVNKVGDYDITCYTYEDRTGKPEDDFSFTADTDYNYIGVKGGSKVIDPNSPAVVATFVCTGCGDIHTETDMDPAVVKVTPATCTSGVVTEYSGTVSLYGKTYTGTAESASGDPTDHTYGDPTWSWEEKWDVVEIDVQKAKEVDIYPGIYECDSEIVYKDSAVTQYIFTGERTDGNFRLNVHEQNVGAATYNICFHNASISDNGDSSGGALVTVMGDNANVNLLFSGNNDIRCNNGYVFAGDASCTTVTTFNVGVEGGSTASINTGTTAIGNEKTAFVKAGGFDLTFITDVSRFNTDKQVMMYNASNDPSPFEAPAFATATFTCTGCQHQETVQATVTDDEKDGVPCKAAAVDFNGKTYTDIKVLNEDNGFIIGDADGNGQVDILDVTAIQKTLAELPTPNYHKGLADTDGDGKVTIIDATYIQRWLAGLSAPDRIGKEPG